MWEIILKQNYLKFPVSLKAATQPVVQDRQNRAVLVTGSGVLGSGSIFSM